MISCYSEMTETAVISCYSEMTSSSKGLMLSLHNDFDYSLDPNSKLRTNKLSFPPGLSSSTRTEIRPDV